MERKDLKKKVAELKAEKEKIEKIEFYYLTGDFYFPAIGRINELEKAELITAHSIISREKKEFIESAKELGFSDITLSGAYGDFTLDDLFKDIKTRAEHIKMEEKLEKIYITLNVLENHLSSDDKFELDMDFLKSEGLI